MAGSSFMRLGLVGILVRVSLLLGVGFDLSGLGLGGLGVFDRGVLGLDLVDRLLGLWELVDRLLHDRSRHGGLSLLGSGRAAGTVGLGGHRLLPNQLDDG